MVVDEIIWMSFALCPN